MLKADSDGYMLSSEMATLCREATWEIDELARILPDLVPNDAESGRFAVRGISGRLLRLSSVLMSALDGDQKDAKEMDRLRNIATLEGRGQG